MEPRRLSKSEHSLVFTVIRHHFRGLLMAMRHAARDPHIAIEHIVGTRRDTAAEVAELRRILRRAANGRSPRKPKAPRRTH